VTSPNDFLYTGEQHDPNSGFYYLRARYMNPANGRFTQQDTFAGSATSPLSFHKYIYANGSPAGLTDPSGHFSIGELGAAGNIAAGLTTTSSPIAGGNFFKAVKDGADPYYQYHFTRFRPNRRLPGMSPRVVGSVYGAQLSMFATVGANSADGVSEQEVFNFIAGVEAVWNKVLVSPSGFTYAMRVNLSYVPGIKPDILINRSSMRDSYGYCRANVQGHYRGNFYDDHVVNMCPDNPPNVAAHEFGHVLGIDDAYDDVRGQPVLTELSDLMARAQTGEAKWYHARVLVEGYRGRQ